MSIRVRCPKCGKELQTCVLPAGATIQCTCCGQRLKLNLPKPDAPLADVGNTSSPGRVQTAEKPPKIAGWLVLPALGMIFGPLGTLATAGEIRIAVAQLRQSGRMSEFPGAESLEVFAVTMAVLLAIVQVVAAVFFFRKRRFVPKMMVGLYGVGIAYGLILLAATTSVFTMTLTPGWLFKFVLGIGFPVLWIGYFLRSKRVKATFIR